MVGRWDQGQDERRCEWWYTGTGGGRWYSTGGTVHCTGTGTGQVVQYTVPSTGGTVHCNGTGEAGGAVQVVLWNGGTVVQEEAVVVISRCYNTAVVHESAGVQEPS